MWQKSKIKRETLSNVKSGKKCFGTLCSLTNLRRKISKNYYKQSDFNSNKKATKTTQNIKFPKHNPPKRLERDEAKLIKK